MRMNDSQLIGLRVETIQGVLVGRLHGIEIETESQHIMSYSVRPSGLVRGLLRDMLLVSRTQVRSISPEVMVIDDMVVADNEKSAPLSALPPLVASQDIAGNMAQRVQKNGQS